MMKQTKTQRNSENHPAMPSLSLSSSSSSSRRRLVDRELEAYITNHQQWWERAPRQRF